jgi:futalosine hydrolase
VNILIVSATEKEINPLAHELNCINKESPRFASYNNGIHAIDILVTGIGLPSTIFQLTNQLNKQKYNLVINAGVAGSFNSNFIAGDIVHVTSEIFGDLGIDDNDQFNTLFEKGFIDNNTFPFHSGKLLNTNQTPFTDRFRHLPSAKGITVNTTSGSLATIEKIYNKFQPDIESMEGAGVFFTCMQLGVVFNEIRAISNKVEPRNIKNWNLPLAIKNLNDYLLALLSEQEK